jgi:hypothetical protein
VLSKETLEDYKKMSPGEKLHLTFELMREGWEYMYIGPPGVAQRKRELWERENDLANQRILKALAESERRLAEERADGA